MKNEIDWEFVAYVILAIIGLLIVIVFVSLEIYTLIEYGNVPREELPNWVLWLWFS